MSLLTDTAYYVSANADIKTGINKNLCNFSIIYFHTELGISTRTCFHRDYRKITTACCPNPKCNRPHA